MAEMPDYDPKNPRCDQEQLAMLKRCSEAEDMSEWNEWREDNPNKPVVLCGADLHGAVLEKANLSEANLRDAKLFNTNLKIAVLRNADLTNANLWQADLENAIFWYSILEGTSIAGDDKGLKANLKSTDFTGAIVNGKTIIQACDIDEKTNFTTVGLDSARIEPALLDALRTNIRRITWEEHFKEQGKSCLGRISTAPMRLFWWLSDYGSSSSRIFISIVIAILFFTDLYLIASVKVPEALGFFMDNAKMSEIAGMFVRYACILCFSIATMVTLGFGNINAGIVSNDPGNTIFIFTIVMLNLVSSYLFLSLIVTRFGILFQSLAPQQKILKRNNLYFYYCAYILFIFGLFYLIFPILYSLNLIQEIFVVNLLSFALYFSLILLFELVLPLKISLSHSLNLYIRHMRRKIDCLANKKKSSLGSDIHI